MRRLETGPASLPRGGPSPSPVPSRERSGEGSRGSSFASAHKITGSVRFFLGMTGAESCLRRAVSGRAYDCFHGLRGSVAIPNARVIGLRWLSARRTFCRTRFGASKIGASGVSFAHCVAEAWMPIACLATFSLVSMYHAANFFAPSTVNRLRPAGRALRTFPNRSLSLPLPLLLLFGATRAAGWFTNVAIEIVLAAASTAAAIHFSDATFPLNPFSVRFLGRLCGEAVRFCFFSHRGLLASLRFGAIAALANRS